MTGPRRNTPCPCGSGKKHKHCCGASTPSSDDARSGFSEEDRVSAMEALAKFVDRAEFEQDCTLAEHLFWGPQAQQLAPEELEELARSSMVLVNFHNFLTLDLDIDDGLSLVDMFLSRRAASLTGGQRRFLQSLQGSHVGLYLITDVRPGEGLRLVGLWGEEQDLWIEERTASSTLVRWDLLATRVLQQPTGEYRIEGDLYPFPAHYKSRILEQLEQDRLPLAASGHPVSDAAFLKRVTFRFNHLWLEAHHQLERPEPETFDGEPWVQVASTFAIESPSRLARALDACEELEDEGEDRWALVREAGGLTHLVAQLDTSSDVLIVVSWSRAHGEQARALVERIAESNVRHLETTYDDRGDDEGEASHPPEVRDAVRLALDEHYRRWLDDEIPALDGSTPRAAALDDRLRPKLLELILQAESTTKHRSAGQLADYDLGWVRRELGLETPSDKGGADDSPRFADLRDYLDGNDLSDRVPPEDRRLVLFLGRIAAAASLEESDRELTTAVKCRRRPARKPCAGHVMVKRIEGDELLKWHCPTCGDKGLIVEWCETPFDLGAREARHAAAGDPLPMQEVDIEEEQLNRLRCLGRLHAPALALLVSARVADGRATLRGDPDEFSALALCIALELEDRDPSQPATRALTRVHALASKAAGREPDLSAVVVGADLLVHEQSRFPRPAPVDIAATPEGCHRIEVRLLDVEPPVQRILELSSRARLADLHTILVLAMGWADTHLHRFTAGRRSFGRPDLLEDERVEDSSGVLLGELLPRVGDELVYEYDFGDSWTHRLRVQSISAEPPERPRLLAGERACPPEDCGGWPGYEHLRTVLADGSHSDREQLLDWLPPEFDPEHFDLARHDARLDRLASAWRAACPEPHSRHEA